jgi:hypothetical protein
MVTRKLAFAKQEHAPRFTFKLAGRHNSSQGFIPAKASFLPRVPSCQGFRSAETVTDK